MKTIFVVDDDVQIGNLLEEVLTREGYGVLRAYSGTEALLVLESRKPDLVLLDLMLPGLSGEELLPKIRDIPVIVLSAKAEVTGKVALLLGGAADYVTKPFDTQELLARIAVALRKVSFSRDGLLIWDDLELDTAAHAVTVQGKPAALTKTEYAILKLLMRDPDRVIAKSAILDRIAEDTPDCTESSLKTHISHLRGKLREISGKDYITAVWGIGFKMAEKS